MNQLRKTYSELIKMKTFEDRLNYLKLRGSVGRDTFGFDRYLNQVLYNSYDWRRIRDEVILRDNGCDLALDGFEIYGKIIIHHMNPITMEDINERNPDIFNPEYLITTTLRTHNAIHYGTDIVIREPIIRSKNDTCPWK